MPEETPKERLKRLLARMPLDRRHHGNLLDDLERIDDAKAAELADRLEPLLERIDALRKPPTTKA